MAFVKNIFVKRHYLAAKCELSLNYQFVLQDSPRFGSIGNNQNGDQRYTTFKYHTYCDLGMPFFTLDNLEAVWATFFKFKFGTCVN
jgi:hypothetical protein